MDTFMEFVLGIIIGIGIGVVATYIVASTITWLM